MFCNTPVIGTIPKHKNRSPTSVVKLYLLLVLPHTTYLLTAWINSPVSALVLLIIQSFTIIWILMFLMFINLISTKSTISSMPISKKHCSLCTQKVGVKWIFSMPSGIWSIRFLISTVVPVLVVALIYKDLLTSDNMQKEHL